MEKGILYVVATPIGNMQDITYRAVKILKEVPYIACEDTRLTGRLLSEIKAEQKPMLISYYEESEDARIPNILNLLINGQSVALVSDSGTPLISDPGYPLIRECIRHGIRVISIPGPSAAISVLVSSGLPTDKFLFLGFLPRKEGHRVKFLEKVKKSNLELESTIVIYEAPHRLLKTLKSIKSVYGDIQITLGRELTKIHEEVVSESVLVLIEKYEKTLPRGEFVVLFNTKDF